MKKLSLKTKMRFIIKTLVRPIGTEFEINYGNGFVKVNRFRYVCYALKELNNI